jgi:hypothetical protein
MPHKRKSDYEVGYGKPPKKSQFKKGRSGNPNGRPKGTSFRALTKHLAHPVTLRIGEKTVTLPCDEALLLKAMVKGDTRLLIEYWRMRRAEDHSADVLEERRLTHEEMLDLLDDYVPPEPEPGDESRESDDEEE